MNFEHETNDERKFALVYPLQSENAEMKKMADDAGLPKGAVAFDRQAKAYRVYEDMIPEGVDAGKLFERFITPDQIAKAQAETASLAAGVAKVEKAAGTEVDESKLYYPLKGAERDAFHALAKESEAKFRYNKTAGAFQHLEGPTAGFERWQTPEAKAAWVENGKEAKEVSDRREQRTAEAVDVMRERANGRHFVADNANGFFLPSKEQPKERQAQIDALKKASPEELAEVYKITQARMQGLERKQYGMQISAAQKADPKLTTEAFNKMDSSERMKASGYTKLNDADFKLLIGVRNGFFEARKQMIEHGLITTRDAAKQMQTEADNGKAADAAPADTKSQGKSAPKNAMAAALLLDAQAGMGR